MVFKIQFYKVIEYLLSNNFYKSSDDHILKIQNEYINNKTVKRCCLLLELKYMV